MKKTARILLVFVFVFVLVSILSGCQYDSDNDINRIDRQNFKKKQLTLFTIQGDSAVNQVIADSADRFEDANKEFDVIREVIANDIYKNRLSVCAATNQMPDVFPTWSGGLLKEYISIGRIVNLSSYMYKDQYFSRFNSMSLKMVTDREGIWGVPVENMSIALIFYNKNIFKSLNIYPPETYEQLLDTIKILKNNGYIPFALSNRTAWTGSMFYMYLVDRLGGPSVFDNAVNRKNGGAFDDATFIQAGEMIQQLVNMGAFPEGFNWLDEDSGDSRELLYNESAAMILAGSWFISVLQYEKPEFTRNVGIMRFPSIEGGRGDPRNTVGTIGDNFYSVASSCAYKDSAFELIKYLIDDIALEKRIDAGRIPPVKEPALKDALTKEVLRYINQSPSVQFWYDQYLPPKLSEAHLTLTREVFGGKDAKTAARMMEEITKEYYKQ